MLVGIFIGGRSSRMGTAKGLLEAPAGGESLVGRLARVVAEACPGSALVLVGRNREYSSLPFEQLPDRASGAGPLAGLVSLLEVGRSRGHDAVIALSCDLPFVSVPLVRRLCEEAKSSNVLVPRPDKFYEAFVARYATTLADSAADALESGDPSLQKFIERSAPTILHLTVAESLELRDWDTPEDVERER